jgi:hypothetical protein
MGIPAAGLNFSDGLPSSIISNAGIDGLCALTQNWTLGFLLIQIKVAHPVVCFELTPRWPFSLWRLVGVASQCPRNDRLRVEMPSSVSATHCMSRTTHHRRASHLAPASRTWFGAICSDSRNVVRILKRQRYTATPAQTASMTPKGQAPCKKP